MKVESGLRTLLTKFMNKSFIKFIFMGCLNTALTYILYLGFLIILPYFYSYFFSYCIGIILSYFLNTLFVFKEKVQIKKLFQFPLVYLAQFAVSSVLLYLIVDRLFVNERLALLFVTVVTIPITFLLSRYIIKK
jgi:putative flippase GtrA